MMILLLPSGEKAGMRGSVLRLPFLFTASFIYFAAFTAAVQAWLNAWCCAASGPISELY